MQAGPAVVPRREARRDRAAAGAGQAVGGTVTRSRMPRPRSFAEKISWLVTATCAVAILGVSLALATANHLDLKRTMFAALEAQTEIVAMNSGAPLVFGDVANATEALAAFRAMPNVRSATLYRLDGSLFASYGKQVADTGRAASIDSAERLVATTLVREQGQPLGRIQVVYDLSELRTHLWRSLAFAVGVSRFAMTLVFFAARRLTGRVLRPIADLGRTARRISETRDYALRAPRAGDDELGAFTDAFNEMLAQVQRQDSDIKASREEAEIASRMKDEFLATLSHELRTPMAPILGWAQILRRLASGHPQVLQAAEVIERNALAQTRIIDDLLDMSRIISGKMRLEVGAFHMRDVVAAALDAVRDTAGARGIALATELAPDLPPLRGDPHRIQQVLWNLLSNAIKFTPEGGHVRLAVERAGADVAIRVSDTGKGILPAFLPHVFERFRQADSSITRVHGGLGLGLAIVKQLVELHGGSVTVHSAGHGQGSTFTVMLPVARSAGTGADTPTPAGRSGDTPAAAIHAPTDALARLRVMVVDDEADARDWIVHVLADAGADVRAACSAAQALEQLPACHADVLLCDIGMPEMDGYALLREVRAMGGDVAAVPAIALTAFARTEDRARALAAGYQLHLGKPVDAAELVAAVASVARARQEA
jgi:signal transduction histidine kinase/CheY-like chemotaxis protein